MIHLMSADAGTGGRRLTAVATKAMLPVKSSAPHTITSSSPNGKPTRPTWCKQQAFRFLVMHINIPFQGTDEKFCLSMASKPHKNRNMEQATVDRVWQTDSGCQLDSAPPPSYQQLSQAQSRNRCSNDMGTKINAEEVTLGAKVR